MKIVVEPKLEMEFTKLQLTALHTLCERHYCHSVKSLCSKANRLNNEVNGVLTIAMYFHEFTNESHVSTLSFRHIDLMLKAMEMSGGVFTNMPVHYQAMRQLGQDLKNAIVEMNRVPLTYKEL